MEVLILLVFVSIVFVAGALAFFAWSLRERTLDHADRLALLPLDEPAPQKRAEKPRASAGPTEPRTETPT